MNETDKANLLDLLWKMYSENTTHGRHHETQRSTVTNLILILAGAVLTLTTFDKVINFADLPASIFLIAIGIFGAFFSAMHYVKYNNHMMRAKQYRIAIDRLLPQINDGNMEMIADQVRREFRDKNLQDPLNNGILTALKRAGDEAHQRESTAILGSITPGVLHALWVTLHFLIIAIGIVLTVTIFWKS